MKFVSILLTLGLYQASVSQEVWKVRSPFPTPYSLNDVAFNGPSAIAVGGNGTVVRNPTGLKWEQGKSVPGTTALEYVAWVGKCWVASSVEGPLYTSIDGVEWTQRNVPGREVRISQFVWNGKIALAVTENGTIMSSENGTDWTVRLDSLSGGFRSVTWTGKKFLAIGLRGFHSTDGITWVGQGNNPQILDNVIWTGTGYLATSVVSGQINKPDSGLVWKSADGEQWDTLSLGFLPIITGLIYAGNQYVAAGLEGFVMTSPDGETWKRRETGAKQNINAIAWTGSQILAVGNFGTLLKSKDGIAWQSDFSGTVEILNSVTYTGEQYIAVGEQSTVVTSKDGNLWKAYQLFQDTPRAQGHLNAVAWGNGLALAGGTEGNVLASTDGLNWKTVYAPDNEIRDILWTGKIWVVVSGYGLIAISEDGKTWSEVSLKPLQLVSAATWTGTEIALAGAEGSVYLSQDGKEWTKQFVGEAVKLVDITWAGDQFVAVGPGSSVFTSSDGKEWVVRETGATPSETINSIAWTGTELIAAGDGGMIFSSIDGKVWKKEASPVMGSFRSVISQEGKTIAVGGWGVVITKGVPDVGIRRIPSRLTSGIQYSWNSNRLRLNVPLETWGANVSVRIFSTDGREVAIKGLKQSDGMLEAYPGIPGFGTYGFEVRGVKGKRASGSFLAVKR